MADHPETAQIINEYSRLRDALVRTAKADLKEMAVLEDLEKKGYEFVSAEVEMVPDTYTAIADPEVQEKMQKMLDLLEDSDDVQNVWHNWDAPEDDEEE